MGDKQKYPKGPRDTRSLSTSFCLSTTDLRPPLNPGIEPLPPAVHGRRQQQRQEPGRGGEGVGESVSHNLRPCRRQHPARFSEPSIRDQMRDRLVQARQDIFAGPLISELACCLDDQFPSLTAEHFLGYPKQSRLEFVIRDVVDLPRFFPFYGSSCSDVYL